MPKIRCTIWFDSKLQGYHLQCSFNPQFIDFVKVNVPVSDRHYDPPTKTWTFAKKYLDPIRHAAEQFFGKTDVNVITEQQTNSNAVTGAKQAQTLDQAMLAFMKLLPFEAALAAFRKAAVALHPDHGGNMDSMTALNTLWDRIEKEVYKP